MASRPLERQGELNDQRVGDVDEEGGHHVVEDVGHLDAVRGAVHLWGRGRGR